MLQEGRRRDYVMKQKLLPPLGVKGQSYGNPERAAWEKAAVRSSGLG